jgi:hypothetical protein
MLIIVFVQSSLCIDALLSFSFDDATVSEETSHVGASLRAAPTSTRVGGRYANAYAFDANGANAINLEPSFIVNFTGSISVCAWYIAPRARDLSLRNNSTHRVNPRQLPTSPDVQLSLLSDCCR